MAWTKANNQSRRITKTPYIFPVYVIEHYIKIPISKKYREKASVLPRKYQQRYYIAYLCFRKYLLGVPVLLQNGLIRTIFSPISKSKPANVYLIVNERDKIMRPKYTLRMGVKQYINQEAVYVFGSIIKDECVFYGWLLGKEILQLRKYHPKGEKREYWRGDEAVTYVNKWEHYTIKITDLHQLSEYNPQLDLDTFISSYA